MQLLERDEPLRILRADFDAAREGAGKVVLVRGEAVMGNTSLVRAFLNAISAEAHILSGASDDQGKPCQSWSFRPDPAPG